MRSWVATNLDSQPVGVAGVLGVEPNHSPGLTSWGLGFAGPTLPPPPISALYSVGAVQLRVQRAPSLSHCPQRAFSAGLQLSCL